MIVSNNDSTIKPVYNNYPWNQKKVMNDELNRPLLIGGRCSEVVVKAGFSAFENIFVLFSGSTS